VLRHALTASDACSLKFCFGLFQSAGVVSSVAKFLKAGEEESEAPHLRGNDRVLVVQCITVDFRLFRHVGGEIKVCFAALMRLRRQIGFEAKPKSQLPDARSGSPGIHLCKR